MARSEAPIFLPDPNGRKTLIIGATGSMGKIYVRRLARFGPVIAMARSDRDVNVLSGMKNVIGVKGDLTDKDSMRRVTENVSTVFNVAGNLSLNDEEANKRVHVLGSQNLAEAANINGVKHVHFLSSVSVYGKQESDDIITEDSPKNPTTSYGRTKVEEEEIFFDKSNKFEASAVRPVNVIGSEIDVYTHLILNFLSGVDLTNVKSDTVRELASKFSPYLPFLTRARIPEPLIAYAVTNAVFPYVDIENVIDLSIESSQNPAGAGQAFNAVDDNSTYANILNAYAKGLFNQKTYKFSPHATEPVLKAVDAVMGMLEGFGLKSLGNARSFLKSSNRYSSEKAETVLGHNHRVSLHDSVARTKDYVDHHGIIRSSKIYR